MLHQSSPRSPPVLKKKSLDVTRLLQARSRIPNPLVASPWHNRAFWRVCPRPDNIPRPHAPKHLTDLTTCTPPRTASILRNRISNHQVRTSPPVPHVPNLRGESLKVLRSLASIPYSARVPLLNITRRGPIFGTLGQLNTVSYVMRLP